MDRNPDTTTSTSDQGGWPFTNVEPASTWKLGEKPRMRKSVSHTISGAMSMLRSAVRRDDFDLAELSQLVELGLPTDILAQGVTTLRAKGYSWADIGAAVGTSREAAYQRYGKACA